MPVGFIGFGSTRVLTRTPIHFVQSSVAAVAPLKAAVPFPTVLRTFL